MLFILCVTGCLCRLSDWLRDNCGRVFFSDPVVVPVESQEEKQEHSDGEKEEDVGITFVARKVETPKQRPKSGGCQQLPGPAPFSPPSMETR